jgi:two-component system invasion response regulator UvrY
MDDSKQITFIVADDHAIVREGIVAFCQSRPELKIIGESATGLEAVDLILNLKPDFAVIDLNMQDLSGLEVIRRVRAAKSNTKLLVLSVNRDETIIRDLFRAGADGYLLKDGPARHLFDAIRFVLDGGQYLTPLLQRGLLDPSASQPHGSGTNGGASSGDPSGDPLALLSKREYEVFSFLVEGKRPKDIARILQISPKTVDTYRANVMRKLEIEGVAGLVRFAIERNIRRSPAGGA